MKILHIISSINRGGAENHLFNLAKTQSKNKNNVKVIYFKGDGYWSKFYKDNNIKTTKFNLIKNIDIFGLFKIYFKLNHFLKKEKPDIVHAHLALPEILITIFKLFNKYDFKFIVTKHLDSLIFEGSYGQNKLISGLFFEKIIFKSADHIIFISKNVRDYFFYRVKNFKFKTSVIYYGIDKNFFNYQTKKKNIKFLRNNKNQFLILNIARHIPQKKIDILIEGFNNFLKKNNNSKLILVGSGPDTKKLRTQAKNLNILENICWIDYAENINDIFKICDLFCLTSKYEGLGLVLLESLFLKKPVVTVNRSAMSEIIKDGFNGISLKKNFLANDLSNAFQKIKQSRKLKSKFKKNGSKIIKEKFNLKKMYQLTDEIYKKSYAKKK